MRLLAFCDYYSADSCGGAERVAREIYTRLANVYEVDVTLVGTSPAKHGRVCDRIEDSIRTVILPGHDLSGVLGAQLTFSAAMGGVVRDLAAKFRPEVLHANSLHFQSSVTASRLARQIKVPLVTTAHLGAVDLLPTRMRLGAQLWDQVFGRFIVASSARMIAVSRSVATHLQHLGAAPDDVTVTYNGVDHSAFHPRGRDEIANRPLRVGFVGRMISNKGPQILLTAIRHVVARGVPIEVTYIGDGCLLPTLRREVARAGLDDVVTFTGQLSDIASRLRNLDVVVRPSFTEGLPLAVIEAMACGAVVVCSDVPGNLELIEDGSTGLVFPAGNSAALTQALIRLAGDRNLLAGLRDKAIAVATGLSWDACAESHFQVLRQVSGGAR